MNSHKLLAEIQRRTTASYGTKQGRRNAAALYKLLDERGEIKKCKAAPGGARPSGTNWMVDGVLYAICYGSKQAYPVAFEAPTHD